MTKPEVQRVPCLHCTRGPKGDQSCSSGYGARTLALGCFLGGYRTEKAPKYHRGDMVARVEAPTYAEAIRIAQEDGWVQWIWVKDGIPQESR